MKKIIRLGNRFQGFGLSSAIILHSPPLYLPRSKHTLGRHALVLDEALDLVIKDRLADAREKTFFGVGFIF